MRGNINSNLPIACAPLQKNHRYDLAILASGGLDSTTLLYDAFTKYDTDKVLAVTMNYGQRHYLQELVCVRYHCKNLGFELVEMNDIVIPHQVGHPLMIPPIGVRPDSIPHLEYSQQDHYYGVADAVPTYVPNRNMILLALLGAEAVVNEIPTIWYGAHAGDAEDGAYPDCAPQFVEGMRAAFLEQGVVLDAPFIKCNKADIVERAIALNVPMEHTWSCYEGGDKPCGVCGTCRQRAAAFKKHGLEDGAYTKDWRLWFVTQEMERRLKKY